MGPIIHDALAAHHTSNLMSCNSGSCISVGLPACHKASCCFQYLSDRGYLRYVYCKGI